MVTHQENYICSTIDENNNVQVTTNHLTQMLSVFIGGGIGASLRFFLANILIIFGLSYQGTMIINILGCLFLGFVLYFAATKTDNLKSCYYLFLTTGIAGGFTTFSTFCYESFILLQQGHMTLFISNLIFSLVFGIIAVSIGLYLGNKIDLITHKSSAEMVSA